MARRKTKLIRATFTCSYELVMKVPVDLDESNGSDVLDELNKQMIDFTEAGEYLGVCEDGVYAEEVK